MEVGANYHPLDEQDMHFLGVGKNFWLDKLQILWPTFGATSSISKGEILFPDEYLFNPVRRQEYYFHMHCHVNKGSFQNQAVTGRECHYCPTFLVQEKKYLLNSFYRTRFGS